MQRIGDRRGLLAGFSIARPSAGVPEIHDVGEEWLLARRPMGWHSHEGWEIHQQVSGSSTRSSDSTISEMSPGDAFISPPGARHRVVNRGTARSHGRFVRFDLGPVLRRHRQIASSWTFGACIHLRGAHILNEPFVQLIREVSSKRPFRDEGLRLSLDALMVAVSRVRSGIPDQALGIFPEAVLEAQTLLDASCERPWPLAELAHRVQLSPSHLLAQFRKYLGQAPHRYLLDRRIARARDLLESSDVPITTLALEIGFASSQHFAKAFKAATGSTPRQHRRTARQSSSLPMVLASHGDHP